MTWHYNIMIIRTLKNKTQTRICIIIKVAFSRIKYCMDTIYKKKNRQNDIYFIQILDVYQIIFLAIATI